MVQWSPMRKLGDTIFYAHYVDCMKKNFLRVKPCFWPQEAEHTNPMCEFRCFFSKCSCFATCNKLIKFFCVCTCYTLRKSILLGIHFIIFLCYRLKHMKLSMSKIFFKWLNFHGTISFNLVKCSPPLSFCAMLSLRTSSPPLLSPRNLLSGIEEQNRFCRLNKYEPCGRCLSNLFWSQVFLLTFALADTLSLNWLHLVKLSALVIREFAGITPFLNRGQMFCLRKSKQTKANRQREFMEVILNSMMSN